MRVMHATFTRWVPVAVIALLVVALVAPEGARATKKGGGGDGGGTVTFSVEVVDGGDAPEGVPVFVPGVTAETNSGTVDNPPSVVIFPYTDDLESNAHLYTYTTETSITQPVLQYRIVIRTITNSAGDITGVWLTGQDKSGHDGGVIYKSSVIEFVPAVEPLVGGYTLHVDGTATLYKCDSVMLKRTTDCSVDVGQFALGDIVYTRNS